MKWTVWAVEDDDRASTPEVFDIAGYERFEDAYAACVEEVRENGAAICAYVTGRRGTIWYALDGLTKEGVYCGPGVTSWRAALAAMNA
jgi:hypothetical protein